ncbi:unnamed protein product [Absidia cylindrospora]
MTREETAVKRYGYWINHTGETTLTPTAPSPLSALTEASLLYLGNTRHCQSIGFSRPGKRWDSFLCQEGFLKE